MKRIFLVGLMLIGGLAGCARDKRKAALFNRPIEPDLSGIWRGNFIAESGSTPMELNLEQNNINVTGKFTSANSSLGTEGDIKGVTTGPTFSLQFLAQIGPCLSTIRGGGENDGTSLSFSVTGPDCQGVMMRGQATLQKT